MALGTGCLFSAASNSKDGWEGMGDGLVARGKDAWEMKDFVTCFQSNEVQ